MHREAEGLHSRYDKEECIINNCDGCKDFKLFCVCQETDNSSDNISLEKSLPIFKQGDMVHFKAETKEVATSNDGPW